MALNRTSLLNRVGNACQSCGVPHGKQVVRLANDPSLWMEFMEYLQEIPVSERDDWYAPVTIALTILYVNGDKSDERDDNLRVLCRVCRSRQEVEQRQRARRLKSGEQPLPF